MIFNPTVQSSGSGGGKVHTITVKSISGGTCYVMANGQVQKLSSTSRTITAVGPATIGLYAQGSSIGLVGSGCIKEPMTYTALDSYTYLYACEIDDDLDNGTITATD